MKKTILCHIFLFCAGSVVLAVHKGCGQACLKNKSHSVKSGVVRKNQLLAQTCVIVLDGPEHWEGALILDVGALCV